MKTLRHIGLALAAALWIPLVACNDLVKVDNRTSSTRAISATPTAPRALRVGALVISPSPWMVMAAATEGQTLVSGLLSDEYRNSDTFGTRQEPDQRAVQPANTTLTGVFRLIHRARLSASAQPTRSRRPDQDSLADPRIAEMWSVAGFTYVIIERTTARGCRFRRRGKRVHHPSRPPRFSIRPSCGSTGPLRTSGAITAGCGWPWSARRARSST